MGFSKVKALLVITPLTILPALSLAGSNCQKLSLDTINYQISAENTVEATKAEVFVKLNATVNSNDLASIQTKAKENLSQLLSINHWAVEDYSQDKTSSGLINVTMILKNRLTSQQLSELTDKIQSLNGRGLQYEVASINYQPSMAQLEEAKNNLRLDMLKQVSDQLAELNKQTNSTYSIYNINFSQNISQPYPRANMMVSYAVQQKQKTEAQPMKVATKVVLNADVQLAKDSGFQCKK